MFYNNVVLRKRKQNFKKFIFRDIIYAKAGTAWVTPKIKSNFSAEIRIDYNLSRTFHLIKI